MRICRSWDREIVCERIRIWLRYSIDELINRQREMIDRGLSTLRKCFLKRTNCFSKRRFIRRSLSWSRSRWLDWRLITRTTIVVAFKRRWFKRRWSKDKCWYLCYDTFNLIEYEITEFVFDKNKFVYLMC